MTAGAGLLEVSELSRSFGGVRAVRDVSFTVREGEILALIGPNGAGKSTLFNIVAGEITADAGRIRFRDRSINRLPAHRIARLGIGRTFQTLRLFPNLTTLENVMVGRHPRSRVGLAAACLRLPPARREERDIAAAARSAMEQLGIADRADAPVSALTFREQRLVEMARALATDPALLLLDEPAAGLNIAETEALGERIRGLRAAGITVLLVEHDMSLVMEISDRIMVLNSGERIAEGAPAEVRSDPAVIEAYLGRSGGSDAARPER